ncbi:MAG: hypothetical protein AAGN64_11345 [Bacteroidota bacterium]
MPPYEVLKSDAVSQDLLTAMEQAKTDAETAATNAAQSLAAAGQAAADAVNAKTDVESEVAQLEGLADGFFAGRFMGQVPGQRLVLNFAEDDGTTLYSENYPVREFTRLTAGSPTYQFFSTATGVPYVRFASSAGFSTSAAAWNTFAGPLCAFVCYRPAAANSSGKLLSRFSTSGQRSYHAFLAGGKLNIAVSGDGSAQVSQQIGTLSQVAQTGWNAACMIYEPGVRLEGWNLGEGTTLGNDALTSGIPSQLSDGGGIDLGIAHRPGVGEHFDGDIALIQLAAGIPDDALVQDLLSYAIARLTGA